MSSNDAASLCKCGCGKVSVGTAGYANGHRANLAPPIGPPPLCACGCGQETPRKGRHREYRRYLAGHHLPKLHALKGPTHPLWTGADRVINGYVFVYRPDHHRARRADGMTKRCYLVAEETLGRPLMKTEEVHHINHDKSDDRPENLEVMTKSEHMRLHMKARPARRGVDASNVRLSVGDVLAIRAAYAAGETGPPIARRYGLSDRHVYAIIHRTAWAHIA